MPSEAERVVDEPPHALGALIGRAGETAEIVALLARARLFTLTGTGGCGKTRLAANVAAESRHAFRDGARWVDLGALADPALVPDVVAARCGIADRGSPGALDALAAALKPRHLLLVLDTCEHLLPACARLVEALLAACPDLHVLATSREALALPGEVVWQVAPLRVPEIDTVDSVEDLLGYPAVALFVARATAALPAFRLTAEHAASVVRICRRVDGLPLALELAAARLRLLSPNELAERLDDALHLLTLGSRTAPPRQHTMRAALDWSFGPLAEPERTLFGRLAVFAGSFPLVAAENVCAGEGIAEGDLLDVLARLVEKSLVTVQDRGAETRYRLLDPVRQYARERLAETGTAAQAHHRHRDWFVALATRASAALAGREQGRWLDRLETEDDDLRAALGWSLAQGDAVSAGQLAAGIWQFWLLRGHLREGRHWLEQILTVLSEPSPLRAHLLWVAGILARPDAARGHRLFDESLAIWRALGDRDGEGRVLGSLGFMTQALGEHRKAAAYLEQSQAILCSSTDVPALARMLTGLALSVLELGDTKRATVLCQDGLALHEQAGDLRGAAAARANLGSIWRARGDDRRAAALWEESLAGRRRIGDRGGEAHVLALLGSLAVDQGDHDRAAALFEESLALRRRMGEEDGIAPVLEGLAAVGAAQRDPVRAVRLAGAAEALRAATGVPLLGRERAAHDRTLATLRARLDAASFARAWDEGKALSLDQTLDLAAAPELAVGAPAPGAFPVDRSSLRTSPSSTLTYALTRRETEVLHLLTFGLTYAQIAETLTISPRTVDAHVRAIYGKLDVRSRSAATRIALQDGLI